MFFQENSKIYVDGNFLKPAEARQILREFVHRYLSARRCVKCGERDLPVLEFDHLDPAKKKFTISHGIKLGVSLETLIEEINKCQILCSNCHRRKTAKEQGWFKYTNGKTNAD